MPDASTINITNEIPNITLSFSVDSDGWNCCDSPHPGDKVVTDLTSNTTQSFVICKTGGHGCNGEQGYFVLNITGNGESLGKLGFNFDSDGNPGFTNNPFGLFSKYQSVLVPNGDHSFQWLITQVVDPFKVLIGQVWQLNQGITTDTGEWNKYAEICVDASVKGLRTYIDRCPKELWTTGLDEASWGSVINAAKDASGLSDQAALIRIFEGFLPITKPSHNGDQWLLLHQFAYTSLDVLDSDPFHVLMRHVRQLNEGITTDAGEWGMYAEICLDASLKGIDTYIDRCSKELWTTGLDQASWGSVINAAKSTAPYSNPNDKLKMIMLGFLTIIKPSHNGDQWAALRQLALADLESDTSIPFVGNDTRARREMLTLAQLPTEISSTHLIKRAGFPARYTDVLAHWKRCHVEYFMRLDVIDPEGCAYFILTHSQDSGGYVGLAKVDRAYVGQGPQDHVITPSDPNFAGAVVWWDLLDKSHPGGCNHPGNGGQITPGSGGQIGPITVIVGQDWTKWYDGYGHVVTPVGNGSKVLFYDFSCLASGNLPTQTGAGGVTSAYMGCLTTEQLKLLPGDDGEISSANIEQGPDGRFYLIAGNANQTVLWTSASLVPDINQWKQVQISSTSQLNDGSSMLAWISLNNGEKSLCYVQSGSDGMNFRQLKYMVVEGEVVGVDVTDIQIHSTHQSDMFGDDDWVADNGSFYTGVGKGVALHGVYKSINDEKGPPDQEEPCIQVRAWYSA